MALETKMRQTCSGGIQMVRLISNRLSVLLVSILGSAIVLAEGAAPSKTIEEQPFNFGTFRTIAHDQMPCVVNIISDLDNAEQTEMAAGAEPSADHHASKGMGSGLI